MKLGKRQQEVMTALGAGGHILCVTGEGEYTRGGYTTLYAFRHFDLVDVNGNKKKITASPVESLAKRGLLSLSHADLPQSGIFKEQREVKITASKQIPEERALVTTTKSPLVQSSLVTSDVAAFGRDPVEIAKAQQGLIVWAKSKIHEEETDLADLEANLVIAKKNKLRQKPWQGRILKAIRKVDYYKKILGGLEAGYWLVPNFDCDVIAVRTTQKKPPRKKGVYHSSVSELPTNSPPPGEGRYVDPNMVVDEKVTTKRIWSDDKQRYVDIKGKEFKAVKIDEEVDFPFGFAKPHVLDATGKAMALKMFDEIGVLPRRRARGDPMVVGKIKRKEGYADHEITFLICWFIDTKHM